MNKSKSHIEIKAELLEGIKRLTSDYSEITLIGLTTTDGFDVKTYTAKSVHIEADKLAAMTSSLCALSNSAAKELSAADFQISIIETETANILFKSTSYLNHDCVVTITAKSSLSLAQARFCIKRFAGIIEGIE